MTFFTEPEPGSIDWMPEAATPDEIPNPEPNTDPFNPQLAGAPRPTALGDLPNYDAEYPLVAPGVKIVPVVVEDDEDGETEIDGDESRFNTYVSVAAAREASYGTFYIPFVSGVRSEAVNIARQDPDRSRLLIMCTDPFYLDSGRTVGNEGNGAWYPPMVPGVPLVLMNQGEVWISVASDTTGTAVVSIINERG